MQYPLDASFFVTKETDTIDKAAVYATYWSLGFGGADYASPRMFGVQLKYRFGTAQ